VRITDRLSQPQQIVAVIALGVALLAVGSYLTNLGGSTVALGWYAYAPLNASSSSGGVFAGGSFWQHGWVRLIIWIALTVVWALAAIIVLRPARETPPAS